VSKDGQRGDPGAVLQGHMNESTGPLHIKPPPPSPPSELASTPASGRYGLASSAQLHAP
jgi:hypothetical protein